MNDPRLILFDGTDRDRKELGGKERTHLADVGIKRSSDVSSSGKLDWDFKSRRPIKDLIEGAEKSEWLAELRRNQPRLSHDQFNDLCRIHPRGFAGHSLDAQVRSENGRGHMRKVAQEVVARPTLFCLGVSTNDAARTNRTHLFDLIAQELAHDKSLLANSRISFIRLSHVAELAQEYGKLMASLVSRLTAPKAFNLEGREGPILLIGETGSGKTELASALHQQLTQQLRRKGSFISINVAAINPSLLESRLHGHRKGSFTDAKFDQPGWFELANDGTLFLDEFQAAPDEIQLQLLDLMRAVSDTVQVARIGEESSKGSFRVKLILATNEPIEQLMTKGKLRQDLFYRIRHQITIPSLHQRLNSEPMLLQRLLCLNRWRSNSPLISDDPDGRDASPNRDWRLAMPPIFDSKVVSLLCGHKWPGNMREFERACFDVYWEYDRSGGQVLDWPEAFARALKITQNDDTASVTDQTVLLRLREAEQILFDHDFIVSRAQGQLAGLKLKSPKALKVFLRRHQEHLVSNRWQDSRARKLLND